MLAKKLIDCICKLNGVEAVAIGGSRASGNNDVKSDYDIYVYFSDLPSEEDRDKLYSEYCKTYEVGNHYFEYEDNCILNDDTPASSISASNSERFRSRNERRCLSAINTLPSSSMRLNLWRHICGHSPRLALRPIVAYPA